MKVLALKGDISLISVEDDALLLDVANRCYYELNDTALFLLKSLEGGCLQVQLRAAVVAAYNIDIETAASDIDRLMAELSRLDLLETREETAAPVSQSAPAKDRRAYQSPLLRSTARIMSTAAAVSSNPKATYNRAIS
jgi:hypothetical protein